MCADAHHAPADLGSGLNNCNGTKARPEEYNIAPEKSERFAKITKYFPEATIRNGATYTAPL
jgi:hypothetical protein